MDLLASLDLVTETPLATGQAQSCFGDGEQSGQAATPAAKRRRRGPQSSPFLDAKSELQCTPSKASDAGNEDDPGLTHCKDEAGEETGTEKTCEGCGRVQASSPSYWEDGQKLQWAFPTGRGLWCQDCHNCWRCCFSPDHNLAMFAGWLARTPLNRRQWEEHLTAYLMLVSEGAQRIQYSHVVDRINSLKFVFKLLGVPKEPGVVVLLGDMKDDANSAPPVDPRSLVTVRTKDGDRIGAFRPESIDGSSSSHVRRPCWQQGVTCLRSRAFLSTNNEDDRQYLRDFMYAEIADELDVAEASGPHQSRLELKFENLEHAARQLLSAFAENSWSMTKESSFTKHVRAIGELNAEANNAGEHMVIEQSQLWVSGLTTVKSFLNMHREFVKAKQRHERLMELAQPMRTLRTFLTEVVKQSIAPTLDLLYFRVIFLEQVSVNELGTQIMLASGMNDIIEQGVAIALSALETGEGTNASPNGKISAEAWVRALLYKGLFLVMEAMPENVPIEVSAQTFLSEVRLRCPSRQQISTISLQSQTRWRRRQGGSDRPG